LAIFVLQPVLLK